MSKIGKPRIAVYMTGFDTCKVEVDYCEIAHTLITATMEHDPKLAAMVFQGVAVYMKLHNLQPQIWEELLSKL